MSSILPGPPSYAGDLNPLAVAATNAANTAMQKAAEATANAGTVAALVAPAQQDAADVAAAKAAAASAASDVAAAKASAVPDASTIAGLVPGAQQDAADVADAKAQALPAAGTVAALVAPAQQDAADAAAARVTAEAEASDAAAARIAAQASAATAAAAVADMTVAPLDSIATSSQVVRGSDLRLGLRGGAACTVGGSTTATALTPVAPFSLVTLGIEVSPLASAAAVRVLWSTGTGNTTSDLRLKIATDGKLLFDEGNGTGFTSSTAYAAAGARWVWCKYDAAANTIAVYADSSDTPVWTYTRINATTLNAITYIGGTGATTAYTGTIRAAVALNFAATVADRIAAMRGEYPHAWLGGTVRHEHSGAWSEVNSPASSGVTINANAGGVLDVTSTASDKYYFEIVSGTAPLLRAGRTIRLRYTLAITSGSVVCVPTTGIGGAGYTAGLTALTAGTNVVKDITVNASLSAGGAVGIKLYFGAAVFRLEAVSIEILGAQLLVGPQDWTRTRGVDMSGNCNDLIYGAGVVAIEPATKARVIAATAAGATVSAGTVATIGTLSGAAYRDAKALAAMRQWDSVSANWRQARPANCAALQAAVTANGTPLVEATAITGNAVVSANAALNLIHTIN